MDYEKLTKWVLANRGFVAASKGGVSIRIAIAGKVFIASGKTIELALSDLFEELEEMYKTIQDIFKNDYIGLTNDK